MPALLHNASAYGSSGMEDRIRKWNQAGSERNQEKSSSVVFVEHSGIWLFLSAVNHGVDLRSILDGCCILADHNCGGNFADTPVWEKDSVEKSVYGICDSGRYFSAADSKFFIRSGKRNRNRIAFDYYWSLFLSIRKSKNDGTLSVCA